MVAPKCIVSNICLKNKKFCKLLYGFVGMKMEFRLEEIFDLQMGKTPSRNNPDYWNSEDNKWISIADLSKCGKYIENTNQNLRK